VVGQEVAVVTQDMAVVGEKRLDYAEGTLGRLGIDGARTRGLVVCATA